VKWVTRAGVHIDRAACAWLIRRHIDPEPQFVFVTDPALAPVDATAFDMPGATLGHHGGDCSFETILRNHELDDPILWRLAQTVHEADLDDERYDVAEARGVDVAVRALSMMCDDEQMLALTAPLFDGLYEYYRRAILLGREPA
jgi:hypothetical protein